MNRRDFWRNFDLNVELHSAGAFIYDGLRAMDQASSIEHEDEVFSVLYHLAVGFERMLKIAIVLAEHEPSTDQKSFEKSLITHNHQRLVQRLLLKAKLNLAAEHNSLIALLGKFYVTYRYDRYNLGSMTNRQQIFDEFRAYLSKGTSQRVEPVDPFATYDMPLIRHFLGKVCRKIGIQLYNIVTAEAKKNGLFTYELRSDSKAYKLFKRGEFDFRGEDIAWRELLVYLMKTGDAGTLGKIVDSIEPLEFDPGDMNDYVKAFRSDAKLTEIIDTVETLREGDMGAADRSGLIDLIGTEGVCFDDEELPEADESDPDGRHG